MTGVFRHPGLDPGYGGIEANYAVPGSFTMDSGSGAGMTGAFRDTCSAAGMTGSLESWFGVRDDEGLLDSG